MIESVIRAVLSNFPLVCLGIALIVAAVRIARGARGAPLIVAREVAFYALGLAGLWGFVFHVFMPQLASSAIGWQPSGFETEVGFANLALAVPGLMCPWQPRAFLLAVAVAATCFLGGAAANHVYEIVTAHNLAPGNAGTILWTDVAIPLLVLVPTLVAGDDDAVRRRRYPL